MLRHPLACAKLLLTALTRRIRGSGDRQGPRLTEWQTPELGGEVWIRRDEAGVAHVWAEGWSDIAYGAGVAMAQDRLWQMDVLRRLATGRLSEIAGDRKLDGVSLHTAGPSLLTLDQFYRALRMRATAQEELAIVSEESLDLLTGFARGVNAWVGKLRPTEYPMEFLLAGIDPEPWRPEDSLIIGKLVGWLLSVAFLAKPILAALAAEPALGWLLPPSRAGCPSIIGDCPLAEAATPDLLARQALGFLGPGTGSNSWVVGGDRTASGKPILCNDPHLLLGLPSLWYPMALNAPSMRVIGASMPGVPTVLIGRNPDLAWGMTAVMADDGDFYRETLNDASTHYLRNGVWHPVEAAEEEFRIRGRRRPVRQTLRFVRHEGVLCPMFPGGDRDAPVSYRWVGLEPWRGLDGVLGMNRARTLDQFGAAVKEFAVPAQNVVVADSQGRFGYFCAGRFPRRHLNRERPCILDGRDPGHAWGGYLSWEEQPRRLDPSEGFIVTANNRVADEPPAALATSFWEPGYRASRISTLLGGGRRVRVSDMARIQADVYSLQAAAMIARLVRPLERQLTLPAAARAARLLSAWDEQVTAESPAAVIYHLFYQEMLSQTIRPAMERHAPGLFGRYLSTLHLAVPAVDAALLGGESACFPQGVFPALERALAAAWERATLELGPDPSAWKWGDIHSLTFRHLFGRGRGKGSRFLAWLFDLNRGPFPRPGDGMTINLGAFILTSPFTIEVGASYRQIVDLGAPEDARWIVAGGVSGDPRSRHYADQISAWAAGETRPMRFLDKEERGTGPALRLAPTTRDNCAALPRVL